MLGALLVWWTPGVLPKNPSGTKGSSLAAENSAASSLAVSSLQKEAFLPAVAHIQ